MFHKCRVWQISDWNITPEQMQVIAKESGWNFCQCQGFLVNVDGRELYLLNDSLTPDPINFFQEYAVVAVAEKTEGPKGSWKCKGVQIESLTVNVGAGMNIADALRKLKDPAVDHSLGMVEFVVQSGESHICEYCA